MRPSIVLITLVLAVGACDQTDAAKANGAAGSINSVKTKGEVSKPIASDDEPTPPSGDDDGGSLSPTEQTRTVAPRDAASGLPTGKRRHKPL